MEMFVFKGIILEEDNTYTALCPELDLASQGASATEAKAALLEAAALHLEGSFEDGLPYLRPIPTEEDPRNDPSATIIETFTFKVDVAIRAYA
jgi:predicted RNase H-like HicB family nuclease